MSTGIKLKGCANLTPLRPADSARSNDFNKDGVNGDHVIMDNKYNVQFDRQKDQTDHVRASALLDAALARADIPGFLDALNILLKAEGYGAVAQRTGLNRTWLYKAISPLSNPGIQTVVSVLSALDLRLSIERIPKGSD